MFLGGKKKEIAKAEKANNLYFIPTKVSQSYKNHQILEMLDQLKQKVSNKWTLKYFVKR